MFSLLLGCKRDVLGAVNLGGGGALPPNLNQLANQIRGPVAPAGPPAAAGVAAPVNVPPNPHQDIAKAVFDKVDVAGAVNSLSDTDWTNLDDLKIASATRPLTPPELTTLDGICKKLMDHLDADVRSTTIDKGFIWDSDKNFKSLTKTRAELEIKINDLGGGAGNAKHKAHLEKKLAYLDTKIAEKLENFTRVAAPGAGPLTDKARLELVGKFQKYASTDESRKAILDVCAKNPELAKSLARDPKTPDNVLTELAKDPRCLESLLSNDKTPRAALAVLIERTQPMTPQLASGLAGHANATGQMLEQVANLPGVATATLTKVVSNKNVDQDLLKQIAGPARDPALCLALAENIKTPSASLVTIATSSNDLGVLAAVARHPSAGAAPLAMIQVLNKFTDAAQMPPGMVRVDVCRAAVEHIPDLRMIPDALLTKLKDKGDDALTPLRLVANERARAAIEVAEQTTDIAHQVPKTKAAIKNCAEQIDAQIAQLEALRPKVTGDRSPFTVDEFTDRIKDLKAQQNALKPFVQDGARMASLDQTLGKIRLQRLDLEHLSNQFDDTKLSRPDEQKKLSMNSSSLSFMQGPGSKIKEALTDTTEIELAKDRGATVNTLGRVQVIRDELNGRKTELTTDLQNLRALYVAQDRSPAARDLVSAQHNALQGMTPANAGDRLATFKTALATAKTAMEAQVKTQEGVQTGPGKLSRSELYELETMGDNVVKFMTTYQAGMDKADRKEATIRLDLREAIAGGLSGPVAQAASIAKEIGQRLGDDYSDRVASAFTRTQPLVTALRAEALDLLRTELSTNLAGLAQALHDDPAQAMSSVPEYMANRAAMLAILDQPGRGNDIRRLNADANRLIDLMGAAERQEVREISNAINSAVANYDKFSGVADKRSAQLTEQEVSLNKRIALIEQATNTVYAASSKSVTVSANVRVPVPGLDVTGRVNLTFLVQRAGDSGQIDIIFQNEAAAGLEFGLSGAAKIGGEGYKGWQTKFSFNNAKDAGGLLHYLETGFPIGYKAQEPVKVSYHGGKLLGEVGGDAGVAVMKGKAMGMMQKETEVDPTGEVTSCSHKQLQLTMEVGGNVGGGKIGVSLDVLVDRQSKKFTRLGMESKPDLELKTYQFTLGSSTTVTQITRMIPGLADRFNLSPDQTKQLQQALLDKVPHRDDLTPTGDAFGDLGIGASLVVRVDFENDQFIGVSTSKQKKTVVQADVDVGVVKVHVNRTTVQDKFTAKIVPQTPAGLEIMKRYYGVDQNLFNNHSTAAKWNNDDLIADAKGTVKKLSEWKVEWTREAGVAAQVDQAKELFIACKGDPTNANYAAYAAATNNWRDGVAIADGRGKSIGQLETSWKAAVDAKATLTELKDAFMTDRSVFKSAWSPVASKFDHAMWDRGLTRNSYIGDRQLKDLITEWGNEQTRDRTVAEADAFTRLIKEPARVQVAPAVVAQAAPPGPAGPPVPLRQRDHA